MTKPVNRRQTFTPKFSLGKVVATSGALSALEKSGEKLLDFLHRHKQGDWGEKCPEEDKRSNDEAVEHGARIISSYITKDGTNFWIITEWDRSVTTAILPSEY